MSFRNFDLFFAHQRTCSVCNCHPQSVASFYYEPMCRIGRAIAETFMSYESEPDIAGWNFVIQDAAGLGDEVQVSIWKELANSSLPQRMQAKQTGVGEQGFDGRVGAPA